MALCWMGGVLELYRWEGEFSDLGLNAVAFENLSKC
jgi:hypothetical protein